MLKRCSTCGRQTKDFSEFPSPYDTTVKVYRCKECRKISQPWVCPSTGKTGP